jgi:hypothetical protein
MDTLFYQRALWDEDRHTSRPPFIAHPFLSTKIKVFRIDVTFPRKRSASPFLTGEWLRLSRESDKRSDVHTV